MFFRDDLDGPLTAANFERRINPLRKALLNMALRDLQPDDAEDCLQTAVCAAWSQLDRYDPTTGQTGLFHWLSTLLRRATADFYRQLNRRAEDLQPSDEFPPDTLADAPLESAEQLARWNEYGSRLGRVVLTDKQTLILKAWLNGETQTEIALAWGISQRAISYYIETITGRLRAEGEIELGYHAELLFATCAEITVYHRPVGVWDRKGNQEQREKRRRRVSADKAVQP